LEVFVPDDKGQLWHLWQTAPNNDWTGAWENLSHDYGPLPAKVVGTPAVANAQDGRLEVFVPGDDGQLWHLWQTEPNKDWTGAWQQLVFREGLRLLAILRSADGGHTFSPLPLGGGGRAAGLVASVGSAQYSLALDVSPTLDRKRRAPSLLALGWQYGPWLSQNGGRSWQRVLGIHDDQRGLHFDVNDPSGRRLHVGSDGGAALIPSLAGGVSVIYHNRYLLNLQFLSPNGMREWWGTIGVSHGVPGLVGGGLQDNGNVYCINQVTAWKHIDGGDGGLFGATLAGDYLRWINDPGRQEVKVATWDSSSQELRDQGIVSVVPASDGRLNMPHVDIVATPVGDNPLYAIAGDGATVYGLSHDGGVHWVRIGALALDKNDAIWAVASLDGVTAFLGTSRGRIFRMNTVDATAVEAELPAWPDPAKPGTVERIAVRGDRVVFAFTRMPATGDSWVLATHDAQHWTRVRGVGLPDELFYGMDATASDLFVSTDTSVYISHDDGDHWEDFSDGLPARPHCSDLRTFSDSSGTAWVYLGTFGRSLWHARIDSG
jgi:hypothetical protein